MYRYLLAITTAMLLAGCQQAQNNFAAMGASIMDHFPHSEPTNVLRPGYEIVLDGKATPIFGSDVCPSAGGGMVPEFFFLGGVPRVGEPGCIILAKDRTSVVVQYVDESRQLKTEQWTIVRTTVERAGRQWPVVGLRRPDGTLVQPSAT